MHKLFMQKVIFMNYGADVENRTPSAWLGRPAIHLEFIRIGEPDGKSTRNRLLETALVNIELTGS